jgi:hypothetical protein
MSSNVTRDHHNLRRNLKLNGNYISNDGGDEGISIADNGTVTIDKDLDSTSAATTAALNIDYDRVGDVSTGIDTNIGIDLDVNATGASGGTIVTHGMDIDVVGDDGGTSLAKGVDVKMSGATDYTHGINIASIITSTSAGTHTGLEINMDKTGVSTTSSTIYGIKIDADSTAANAGSNIMSGIHNTPTLTHNSDAGTASISGLFQTVTGSSNGTSTAYGINQIVTGSDTQIGIQQKVDDGQIDIKLLSSADVGDYCTIATTTHGATTITTLDDDAAAAHLQFMIDGHVEFDNCAVGFAQVEEAFSDDTLLTTGGTHDTQIDFRSSNKIYLDVTASMNDMNLIFPAVSGNFLLLVRYNGDWAIDSWKAWESDLSAATTANVLWSGGTEPNTTNSGRDIFTFYWDYEHQVCYGVASLAFATP